MSKYVDCCPATCPNAKCRDTGACQDHSPVVESPSLVPRATCCDETASVVCGDCPRTDLVIRTPQPAYSAPARTRVIDANSATRKTFPMAAGLLDYFPDALAEVSRVSFLGNQKHNPGEPLHHARGKSMDHADCIIRHLVGRGGFDGELRESAALAWRALALLQEELERELSLPLPRGAR